MRRVEIASKKKVEKAGYQQGRHMKSIVVRLMVCM